MAFKQRLGEILVNKGLVTPSEIDQALRLQVGGNRRVGYLLIQMGFITGDQLLEALSDQLEVPIIAIKDQFSPAAKKILPRYLCRKYSVLPLSLEKNKVLNLAMLNPLDDQAIADVEAFSGMAVKPVLAREIDISNSISKNVPFSAKDIFNPQMYGRAAKIVSSIAILLLLVIGYFMQQNIQKEKFGTVSTVGNSTIFKNYDLMVGVNQSGKVSLLGHGAYSKGYYSVSFNNIESMDAFVERKKKDFSEKQFGWLDWVINQNAPRQG
ncbi:MAG: hypothetical protein U9O82_04885 [Thermodesulfobacteriota bacterium]|nr:hypothetical protein [Thermodesulfobacteriota bacterium]